VYLVNPDGAADGAVDLPKLLAPIWRWRWVELMVLIAAVLLAGWYYTRSGGETRYEIVVDRGNYGYEEVKDHLNRVLLPAASATTPETWIPDLTLTDRRAERLAEISTLSVEEEQQLTLQPELLTISFATTRGDAADHADLAADLTSRLEAYAGRMKAVVATNKTSEAQTLSQGLAAKKRGLANKERALATAKLKLEGAKRALADKETAYRIISEPSYVAALKGAVDSELARTRSSINKQELLLSSLADQTTRLTTRDENLQQTLGDLITSLDAADASTSGTAQLLADRIATLRVELEQRIPRERIDIDRRALEAEATIERLQIQLTQQELTAINFESDLAIRQENAQDAITVATERIDAVQRSIDAATQALDVAREDIADAELAITLFDQKAEADVIHQPLTIVGAFERSVPNERRAMMTLAILVLGGMCSVGSAYGLEALRLARLGTLAD